ncbi:MAG: hypothetical protein U0840_28090 [Gemmataceae bacterium]
MPEAKMVLFLCTGNYYRSRFAEILFNSVATKLGLAWRATSAALALERGVNNVGPMAVSAVQALQALGVRSPQECSRMPRALTEPLLTESRWIVALSDLEHRPLVIERFPAHLDRVEFWEVADAPGVLPLIEREVMDLVARLMRGGRQRDPSPPPPAVEPVAPAPQPARPRGTVKVGRETKGRRGKGVTIVSDLPVEGEELLSLAARLKERCGTGGTVKDNHIEIQGDLRDRVTTELEKLGYKVKRVGG